MCEMKMTIWLEPSSCSTSDPAASASSRHALVDFMMRPCALKTPKGITSIGVVSSNCCPNRRAALAGARALIACHRQSRRLYTAILLADSAAISAARRVFSEATGIEAAADAQLVLPGVASAGR